MEDDRIIELTPWDLKLLLVDQIQKGLLFHKPAQPINYLDLVQHLKSTLSQTLAIFYPLAGRFAMVHHGDENDAVSFSVNCNGDGALFVHAVIDGVSVSDILNTVYVPDDLVYSFFPINGVLSLDGVSKPLVAIQLTGLMMGFS